MLQSWTTQWRKKAFFEPDRMKTTPSGKINENVEVKIVPWALMRNPWVCVPCNGLLWRSAPVSADSWAEAVETTIMIENTIEKKLLLQIGNMVRWRRKDVGKMSRWVEWKGGRGEDGRGRLLKYCRSLIVLLDNPFWVFYRADAFLFHPLLSLLSTCHKFY